MVSPCFFEAVQEASAGLSPLESGAASDGIVQVVQQYGASDQSIHVCANALTEPLTLEISNALVEILALLLEDQLVRIAIELLKGQGGRILCVNLAECRG